MCGAKLNVQRLERTARREGPLALSMSPTAAVWRAEERRAYFNLLQRKQRTYWTERVDADQSHPCRLWRSFDEFLGRGRPQPPDIDATAIHRYLDDKVNGVRIATSDADREQAIIEQEQRSTPHLSRSARQAAHSRIFILSRQLMSRHSCVHCPISSVPPIHSRPGC